MDRGLVDLARAPLWGLTCRRVGETRSTTSTAKSERAVNKETLPLDFHLKRALTEAQGLRRHVFTRSSERRRTSRRRPIQDRPLQRLELGVEPSATHFERVTNETNEDRYSTAQFADCRRLVGILQTAKKSQPTAPHRYCTAPLPHRYRTATAPHRYRTAPLPHRTATAPLPHRYHTAPHRYRS